MSTEAWVTIISAVCTGISMIVVNAIVAWRANKPILDKQDEAAAKVNALQRTTEQAAGHAAAALVEASGAKAQAIAAATKQEESASVLQQIEKQTNGGFAELQRQLKAAEETIRHLRAQNALHPPTQ